MAKRSKIEKADLKVAKAAASARQSWPVRLLGTLSELADQPPLIGFCAGLFAFGLVTRDRRLASAGGRMLAAELLATEMKSQIKHRVDRTRPRVAANGKTYRFEKGDDHASGLNSFPSGHTAGAVAVARAYAREYPEYGALAYGAAAAVAAIQIPRCQHYPSDLAVGAAIGLVAEVSVHRAERLVAGIGP
jgi:membrane-associated phospholipid phosphatase